MIAKREWVEDGQAKAADSGLVGVRWDFKGFGVERVAVGAHTYWTDRFGVHHQDGKPEMVYNPQYVAERYDSYGVKTRAMSCLRLGWLASVLPWGHVRSVLDVGYGNGDFLKTVSASGKGAFGTDVSGYKIDDPNVEVVGAEWIRSFDGLVTFFDTLEHFESIEFLASMRAKWIAVSAPWCHWKPGEPEFESWKHRRPGEHLHHFDPWSIEMLMQSVGYQGLGGSNVEDGLRGGLKAPDGVEMQNIFTMAFVKAT